MSNLMANQTAIKVIGLMFLATITGIVVVTIFTDPETAFTVCGLLVGLLAPTIASIAVLSGQKATQEAVQGATDAVAEVKRDTGAIRNGEMQAKVKSALNDVLNEHLPGGSQAL